MEELYTPQEIADKLKVSLKTVYRWIEGDNLKAKKIGHFWRVSESELIKFINQGEKGKEGEE